MSDVAAASEPQSQIIERFRDLVSRAEKGEAGVMPELRVALDANPWIWQRYGDLGKQAIAAWLDFICGANLMLHESLDRKVAQLKASLAGPQPTPLEELLVARVVACWLQVHHADVAYTQTRIDSPARQTAALRQQSAAQQRYLQAIKVLATVTRLLRPAPSPMDVLRHTVNESPGEMSGKGDRQEKRIMESAFAN